MPVIKGPWSFDGIDRSTDPAKLAAADPTEWSRDALGPWTGEHRQEDLRNQVGQVIEYRGNPPVFGPYRARRRWRWVPWALAGLVAGAVTTYLCGALWW